MTQEFDTIAIGNRMAQRIIATGPRPNYSATLRHMIVKDGPQTASELAMTFHDQAGRHLVSA